MNVYPVIVLAALVGRYLLSVVTDVLNVRNISEELPSEFADCYDAERYRISQRYLRENTSFGLITDTVALGAVLVLILAGGFNAVDRFSRFFGFGPVLTGLIFVAIIFLIFQILRLPFSIYDTFVIEEKYGFNKTTPRTFVLDIVKGLILAAVVGGPILAGILWFFGFAGSLAWLYCWGAVTAIQVLLIFLAPYVIMPLFNKFEPLEEGALRSAIEDYARTQRFRMKGVYKMDGSKRSSKTNAFFTGFGKSRRIVLFDTLIAAHTVPELLAVVAHEMGHYKKHHIPWAIARATVNTGITFFIMSLFINNESLIRAFRMECVSIHASLVFFGFLYAPISTVISIAERAILRRQEYAADAYAAETTGDPDSMIAGLKKLSVDNLSNLTPHPLKVFVEYSHPPVLARIRALRAREPGGSADTAEPTDPL